MERKRLFWLEYGRLGGPIAPIGPFEAIGFETQVGFWATYDDPNVLVRAILPKIESFAPDILVFLMHTGIDEFRNEPPEWITACQLIRSNPKLNHIKIMAILSDGAVKPEQKMVWQKRYDFYKKLPLHISEYSRIAKQLVNEPVFGYEGVNYYLSGSKKFANGDWLLQPYLFDKRISRDENQADATGTFTRSPKTRIVMVNSQGQYIWKANSIKSNVPTFLVYVIKTPMSWQNGLDVEELQRLTYLAQQAPLGCQLLIGVNEGLMNIGSETVKSVLNQAEQAGGWQLFINEHIWFETTYHPNFEEIVYEGKDSFLML